MEQVPFGTEKKLSEYLFRILSRLDTAITNITNIFKTDVTSYGYLINGNMDVWQAPSNLGSTSANAHLADMWKVAGTGNTHVSSSYEPPNYLTYPEGCYKNLFVACTPVAGAGNYTIITTYIPDIHKLAGKTLTLTFSATVSTPIDITIDFVQTYSTIAQTESISVKTINIKSLQWKKYSVTFTMPKLEAITIDTTNRTKVNFWIDAGSSFASRTNGMPKKTAPFTIHLTGVSLCDGTGNVKPIFRSFDDTLNQCEAFFQKSFSVNTVPASNVATQAIFYMAISAGATVNRSPFVPFRCRMSSVPAVTLYNPYAAGNQVYNVSISGPCTTSTVSTLTETGFLFYCYPPAVGAVNNLLYYHWTADARF